MAFESSRPYVYVYVHLWTVRVRTNAHIIRIAVHSSRRAIRNQESTCARVYTRSNNARACVRASTTHNARDSIVDGKNSSNNADHKDIGMSETESRGLRQRFATVLCRPVTPRSLSPRFLIAFRSRLSPRKQIPRSSARTFCIRYFLNQRSLEERRARDTCARHGFPGC